jgi:hypothetical protein
MILGHQPGSGSVVINLGADLLIFFPVSRNNGGGGADNLHEQFGKVSAMKTNDSVESVTLLSNPHVALHAGGMMDDYHGLRGVSLVVEGASPVPNAEQLAIALENLVKRIGKRESCFVIDLNIPEVEDSWSHGPSRWA